MTLENGAFEGLFGNGETREQRQEKKYALLVSAENVARTMSPQAGIEFLNKTEMQLFGRLLDGTENKREVENE